MALESGETVVAVEGIGGIRRNGGRRRRHEICLELIRVGLFGIYVGIMKSLMVFHNSHLEALIIELKAAD